MGTTVQKLQAILNSKAAIKTAIENNGVTVGDKLSDYAGKISGISDGLNGFLSVESKTIATSASQTANIAYNKKCGIYDENGKKWDTLEWHQRWVDNGYSAEGLSKPAGIWMDAFGFNLIYLWPLYAENGYSDVTGTIAVSKEGFALFIYNQNPILAETAADRTVWPANQEGMIAHGTAGKYRSATFRTQNNSDGLDMVCDNTLETFTIPSRNIGAVSAFMADNHEDYMASYYEQCEFCRALFAICSGIATTEVNGETTTVEILNASGEQAAVGEDMYFWIGGTNTGLLAKYNLTSNPVTTGNTTKALVSQAVVDGIYNKQKTNGVNMNDTGVNSALNPVLLPGMKGAEAIAVNGYWYIKTPYLSNPNAATFNANSNIADAPAVYFCKHKGVSLMSERMLYPYWLNKRTHIAALINLLRTTEGMSADVPAAAGGSLWSAMRYNAISAWCVNAGYGNVNSNNAINRYGCVTCPSVAF